jgi:hypothetical protein
MLYSRGQILTLRLLTPDATILTDDDQDIPGIWLRGVSDEINERWFPLVTEVTERRSGGKAGTHVHFIVHASN